MNTSSLTDFLRQMLATWQRQADRVAVSDESANITYRQLARMTAWYQSQLALNGAKKAALLLPPGAAAYAAEIACAASGICFSPVHLAQPPERQARMIEVFAPDVILGLPAAVAQLGLPHSIPIVSPGQISMAPVVTDQDEAELVYVMFTSGSTGAPKGARIRRRGLAAFLDWAVGFYAVTAADVWGQYSHMGFDLSICDVFTALHGGACLVPFSGSYFRSLPARVVQAKRITIWHSVPTAFKFMREANELTADRVGSLRLISFCGEILLPNLVTNIFEAVPGVHIANTYGPTETTVFCSACRFDRDSWRAHCQGNISIGTPFAGWNFHLEGSGGDEELFIYGDWIGAGYEGTADQGGYVTFDGEPAYRTGDYVKLINGAYYFIGRRDRQIKIRGNRIELDEIDRALQGPGVLDAASVFRADRIRSFVVLQPPASVESVQAAARARLPDYAIPHYLEVLPALPKNANGKTDYLALADRPEISDAPATLR